ncbi:hypothetical protein [Streptomyces sp. NBC_01767]|uniref:hypothetical protein n=1 Tax=Streptomyces sp. NBC_01767 TaxID=2975937 RepID=UPI002256FDFD|nr:hypothetical protein [Streptomyces sp. NBC_01767]MCX4391448.1 hypothetical protein [Streptomyces sp. NBC_01767]
MLVGDPGDGGETIVSFGRGTVTHVWIMRRRNSPPVGTARSSLVRADAITRLSMYDGYVRASELGSDEVAVLAKAEDGGHNAPPLPGDFHTDLIFAITQARRDARNATDDPDEEDRILMAQLEDGDWVWKTFRPSEPEPKPS